jgi:hypothetical protein
MLRLESVSYTPPLCELKWRGLCPLGCEEQIRGNHAVMLWLLLSLFLSFVSDLGGSWLLLSHTEANTGLSYLMGQKIHKKMGLLMFPGDRCLRYQRKGKTLKARHMLQISLWCIWLSYMGKKCLWHSKWFKMYSWLLVILLWNVLMFALKFTM